MDGGHNVEAMLEVGLALCGVGRITHAKSLHLVYACGASRDPSIVLGTLAQQVTQQGARYDNVTASAVGYTTPEGMPWAACMSPDKLAPLVASVLARHVKVQDRDAEHEREQGAGAAVEGSTQVGTDPDVAGYGTVQEAVQAIASTWTADQAENTIIAMVGSLYLVADVHRWVKASAPTG